MIERRIIIGLITSTEYLEQIQDIWDISFIESPTAKKLSLWCWEYFYEYQKAPNREIENIYYAKLKQSQEKDLFSEIEEEILPGLSKEYENQSFNLEKLLKETRKYFDDRHLLLHYEKVEALRTKGQIEEAEKLATDFKPLGSSATKIDDFVMNIKQVREMSIPQPTTFFSPWLRAGQLTIIYASAGCGKTLLSIAVAYCLGLREYDKKHVKIGEWQVKNTTGTLYVDGEMGVLDMEERVKGYEWMGQQLNRNRLQIFSLPEYQAQTEDVFLLSSRVNQMKIIKWLKNHPTYRLVVLDSATTLFGLEDENSNSEWSNKINPFIRELRSLGVACILLHHTGKDGRKGLRGASAATAMAQNIFQLTQHPDQDIDSGEAWFVLNKDKQRSGGFQFKPFALHFYQDGEETHWEETSICSDKLPKESGL